MTLDTTIDRDAEIVNAALREAFKRAGIPTSVAVDDPECLAKVATALDQIAECESAQRQGGPDPMDLEGLDAALSSAVDEAVTTLRALKLLPALSAIKGDG